MTHFLQRTALIALATGALGACSTTDSDAFHPNYPVRLPETPPAAPASTPAPAAAPPAAATPAPVTAAPAPPVEERPLAPLAAPPPPPARPAPPVYRTVTTRSVTGKVVEVEGPAVTYRVKKGDTLTHIADSLGSSVAQLREDNGIGKGEAIHPGDELKGPATTAHAYIVESGDTLYSIARRFDVTVEALRDANDMGADAGLRPNQKIRLPDGYHDRGPLVSTTRVAVAQEGTADDPPEVNGAPDAPREELARPAPPQSATPSYRTVTTRSVTGRVVEVEGRPATYTVRKGDNLDRIADRLGTSVDQLRDDNDIGKRGLIHPGQTLKGPPTTAHAYVAGEGDTLSMIGKRFAVTAEALREENDLGRNASLRPGQRIRLPEGYRDRGALVTTTRVQVSAPATPPRTEPIPRPYTPPPRTYSPPPSSAPAAPPPSAPATLPKAPAEPPRTYSPPANVPSAPPPGATSSSTPVPRPYVPPPASVPSPSAALSDAQIVELSRGRFVWPLQGTIISDFGPKAPGQRNDGINIGAALGTSVRAAAAGDVVYAGDQVPGFGNLVLIKHADGWVTAYGHLSRVLVKMQERVAQGQEIGQTGATGGVTVPQLHFEVRYASSPLERAKPVDPKLVLPK